MASLAAVNSLSNLSVAPDTGVSNQGLLMPKLQFRFRVAFLNFGLNQDDMQLTRQVVECSRPNLSFQKITLPVYNSTIYMAGKHTWQTLSVNIRDDAGGVISRAVGEQLQRQLDFVEQASAAAASDYKFGMTIEMLDGGNGNTEVGVLEKWSLLGCFLESVNWNQVNYGGNEDVKIALTIAFDNAVQSDGSDNLDGAGVGTPAVVQPRQLTSGDVGLVTGVAAG